MLNTVSFDFYLLARVFCLPAKMSWIGPRELSMSSTLCDKGQRAAPFTLVPQSAESSRLFQVRSPKAPGAKGWKEVPHIADLIFTGLSCVCLEKEDGDPTALTPSQQGQGSAPCWFCFSETPGGKQTPRPLASLTGEANEVRGRPVGAGEEVTELGVPRAFCHSEHCLGMAGT